MANYTFSDIAVEGPKDVLEKISKAIQESNGYANDAIEKLGLSSIVNEFDERTEWTDARTEDRDGQTVLFFQQAYPWTPEFIIEDVLDELCAGEYTYYHLSNEWEDIVHYTDDEEGKYFPARFIVRSDVDDEDVFVVTEQDVIENIKKRTGAPDDLNTVDELTSWADENDIYIDVIEIDVEEKMIKIKLDFIDFEEKEPSELYAEICEQIDIVPSVDFAANKNDFIKLSDAKANKAAIENAKDWEEQDSVVENAPAKSMLTGYRYFLFQKSPNFLKNELINEERILRLFSDFLKPIIEDWEHDSMPGTKASMVYKVSIAAFAFGAEIANIGLVNFIQNNLDIFKEADWFDDSYQIILEHQEK